jgi:excisionase family DNA binding protein
MTTGQIRIDLESALPVEPTRGVNGNGGSHAARDRPLTRDDVMTAREVGALLHLPGSSVYELARRGTLPGHRIGRAWRFIRQEIEDWLRAS